MRFTPSTNWTIAAQAAHRLITWSLEIKKTTSLSDALTAGTWVDVSKYAGDAHFPIGQKIEFEVGQFSSDSINVVASFQGVPGIPSISAVQYFKDNIFNASASQYLEVKVKASIGISATSMSTDVFYAFTGFIDKAEVNYGEGGDTVSFTVFTADELGNRISVLNVNTQYINPDIDGAGTDGIILPRIPGITIKSANVTSYVLKVGLHTIEYEYNSGTERARLDGGAWLTLRTTDGVDTLVSEDGLEKVDIYVVVTELSSLSPALTDYIIVTTAGTTLPSQPYYKLSLKSSLQKVYEEIGITDCTFDTLELNTNDGTQRISFFEQIPEDSSLVGHRSALVGDGTNLYCSAANKIYKRTMSTGAYSLITTFSSDAAAYAKKLMYNTRNNDLWIYYESTNGDCIKKYDIDGATLSSEVVLDATVNTVNRYSVELTDVNYTGSSWKYGILWMKPEDPAVIRFIDSGAMTSSAVYNYPAGVSCIKYRADFIFTKTTNDFQLLLYSTAVVGTVMYQFNVDAAGTWTLVGALAGRTTWTEFSMAAYHPSEDVLYYFEYAAGGITTNIKSLPRDAGGAATTVLSGIYYRRDKSSIIYADSKVFTSVRNVLLGNYDLTGTVYSIVSNAGTVIDSTIYSQYGALTYQGHLYGIDATGTLYQYHTVINMFVNNLAPEDTSVREYCSQLLKSYNLIGIISSHKKAFIYRRGNDSGTIQTTGNNLVLNKTNVTNITQIEKIYQKIDWLQVTNGTTTWSYDGTTYNSSVLSEVKKLTISNSLIPDGVVKDVCKYMFTFYNANHDGYKFETNIASMEYEVMDGASVTFTDTRIQKTATGLMEQFGFDKYGNINCDVIF